MSQTSETYFAERPIGQRRNDILQTLLTIPLLAGSAGAVMMLVPFDVQKSDTSAAAAAEQRVVAQQEEQIRRDIVTMARLESAASKARRESRRNTGF